jgi:hypothetical protein
MLRATTIPAAPQMPAMPRMTMSVAASAAIALSTEASVHPITPMRTIGRRPRSSLSGPHTSWPTPMPSRHAVTLACTIHGAPPSSSCMVGSEGM